MAKQTKTKGKVYLVGAGPGRMDLITVRGLELLKKADCIICDKLVNPALLDHVRPDAEILNVPKRIGDGSFTQTQINKLLVKRAAAGRTVVRLKGGDPCIFGRGAEEAKILADAGVDFEIVPGVTAAIAAGEYAGIMLTDRNYSSQVVFVTGREAQGKKTSSIDWHLLARFNGTVVFYMGLENADYITGNLLKNGSSPDTPAALVSNATKPSQKTVKTTLGRLIKDAKRYGVESPAILVIGTAAKGQAGLNWFECQPLFGQNIVVCRDEKGNYDFAAKIIESGGNPVVFDNITIESLMDKTTVSKIIRELPSFDWVVFTSKNGVSLFFDALKISGRDARVFGHAKIAVVGSITADELAGYGLRADFVPTVFTTEQLGRQMLKSQGLKGSKVLLLRSKRASGQLADILRKGGAIVEDKDIYTVRTKKSDSGQLKQQITSGSIDWLTFTSSSAAAAFFGHVSAKTVNSSKAKVASIGPMTTEELKKLGIKIDLEAKEHTIDGLLEAMVARRRRGG